MRPLRLYAFLGPLLTQLYADLYADPPDHLNPVAGTVVYRKLLSEASTELSKASKLTAVTVFNCYASALLSARSLPTSSTTSLQLSLQPPYSPSPHIGSACVEAWIRSSRSTYLP